MSLEVFIDMIFPAALCSWGHSPSIRNEYREYFLGVKAANELENSTKNLSNFIWERIKQYTNNYGVLWDLIQKKIGI
jgi:hypothetical protein